MKPIACKVSDKTYEDLKDITENSDISVSEWVRGLIEDEFDRLEEERKAYEENEQKEPVKGTLEWVPDNSDKPAKTIEI